MKFMKRSSRSPLLACDESAHLKLNHISAGYNGTLVLSEVSAEIPCGAKVAVVGPNGAGKSTLFKALVGLLPLKAGAIFIHGHPLGYHQDCVAYVPQRSEVDWRFPVTVEDVVLMGRYGKMSWLGRPSRRDVEVVHRSLESMGIFRLRGTSIGDLSGGQQQRVFLARALAQEPHILLLDEPFTGVDAATQEATLDLLEALHQEGVTTLVSTHDLNMASSQFEEVLLLNRRLVAYGTPMEVFRTENLRQVFSGQLLTLQDMIVVDQCCPPNNEGLHS